MAHGGYDEVSDADHRGEVVSSGSDSAGARRFRFKPRSTQLFAILRTWGAAVLRPYMILPGTKLAFRPLPSTNLNVAVV